MPRDFSRAISASSSPSDCRTPAISARLFRSAAAINRDLPIFMAHGTADPVVRFEWGDASRRALVANGYRVDWHAYRMEHSVCMEEIEAIGAWLVRTLAAE